MAQRPRRAPTEPGADRNAGGVVRVRSASDVVDACDLARHVARTLGFNALDQTKIVTAASELARNIMLYAGDGEVRISTLETPRRGACRSSPPTRVPASADIERVDEQRLPLAYGHGNGAWQVPSD